MIFEATIIVAHDDIILKILHKYQLVKKISKIIIANQFVHMN